jgi:predicted negative regulator of RcsB-dependent stress response
MPHGSKLERHSEGAIAALLEHGSVRAAAAASGIAESTLNRWLAKPAFSERYRKVRAEVVKAATAKLRAQASSAVDTLSSLMLATATPPQARIAAARTILELALKTHEDEQLLERLETIEAAIGGN